MSEIPKQDEGSLLLSGDFGRYRIIQRLAQGGMSSVYLAEDTLIGRRVALKVPEFGSSEGPEARKRFIDYALAAATVHHPSLCPVYDVGEIDGRLYLTTPYIEGQSLAESTRGQNLPPRVVASLVGKLALALREAHAKGLIHRRLKPSNVMITTTGPRRVPVILDFGLVHRDNPDEVKSLSSAGEFIGTPVYMAPEQISGDPKEIGPACDIYALGVILYELLTGRLPFTGSAIAVMTKILIQTPEPPSMLRSDLDPQLEAICLKAMAKSVGDRYATMAEMAAALTDYLRSASAHRSTPATSSSPSTPAASFEQNEANNAESDPPRVPVDPEGGSQRPPLDEIQFTVYRPKMVRPTEWYPLLAFAHLAERRPDAPAEEPDPIARVRIQAEQILGASAREFRDTSVDARQAIPRSEQITLVPHVPGIQFNPDRRSFVWLEDIHKEEFRLRADTVLDGTTARGRLSAFLGAILLAEVDLAIKIDSAQPVKAETREEPIASMARPYRKIFASYSHRDTEIVRQYEAFMESTGDRYLRDIRDLRCGEKWDPKLLDLIGEADIFQLFWSSNSMRSLFVRREWEHALALGRTSFIRPTYWEDPLPESEDDELPPDSLRELHFHRISSLDFVPRGLPTAGRPRPEKPPSQETASWRRAGRKQRTSQEGRLWRQLRTTKRTREATPRSHQKSWSEMGIWLASGVLASLFILIAVIYYMGRRTEKANVIRRAESGLTRNAIARHPGEPVAAPGLKNNLPDITEELVEELQRLETDLRRSSVLFPWAAPWSDRVHRDRLLLKDEMERIQNRHIGLTGSDLDKMERLLDELQRFGVFLARGTASEREINLACAPLETFVRELKQRDSSQLVDPSNPPVLHDRRESPK